MNAPFGHKYIYSSCTLGKEAWITSITGFQAGVVLTRGFVRILLVVMFVKVAKGAFGLIIVLCDWGHFDKCI